MTWIFYLSGTIACLAALMVILQRQPAHAVLFLVVTLLSLAVLFFDLGAPFVGVLEIIVYAGAIMVLFVFVVMLLNLGGLEKHREAEWLKPQVWLLPSLLVAVLGIELVVLILRGPSGTLQVHEIPIKQLSQSLFGEYLLGVEIASFLLLSGLLGAYHLGVGAKKFTDRPDVDPDREAA